MIRVGLLLLSLEVSVSFALEGLVFLYPPPHLNLTPFLVPLPKGSLVSERRDSMETSHLAMTLPRLSLCIISGYGYLYVFQLLLEEDFLIIAEHVTDL